MTQTCLLSQRDKLLLQRARYRVKRHKTECEKECDICSDTMCGKKRMRMPTCRHMVCVPCGMKWFKTKGNCPICRAHVMPQLPDPNPAVLPAEMSLASVLPRSITFVSASGLSPPPPSPSQPTLFHHLHHHPLEMALDEHGHTYLLSPASSTTSSSASIDYGSSESSEGEEDDDDDDDDWWNEDAPNPFFVPPLAHHCDTWLVGGRA